MEFYKVKKSMSIAGKCVRHNENKQWRENHNAGHVDGNSFNSTKSKGITNRELMIGFQYTFFLYNWILIGVYFSI